MKIHFMAMLTCGILTAAGCSGPQIHPANLDDFPGTEHMARGPGLFSDQLGSPGGNGTVVYSSEPASEQGQSAHAALASRDTAPKPPPRAESGSKYQGFEAFRAFQRFQKLPADAPEKKAFRQWLEWKGYLQWKAQHQAE